LTTSTGQVPADTASYQHAVIAIESRKQKLISVPAAITVDIVEMHKTTNTVNITAVMLLLDRACTPTQQSHLRTKYSQQQQLPPRFPTLVPLGNNC
jgi:hypothetical protein